MTECAPEMPVKSALVPMGAESVRRCSSVPPMREGAHFGAGLKSPCQIEREREREREFLHGVQEEEGDRDYRGRATTAIVLDQIDL